MLSALHLAKVVQSYSNKYVQSCLLSGRNARWPRRMLLRSWRADARPIDYAFR